MDKYSHNISCRMSNQNHTCLAIFGMLLIVSSIFIVNSTISCYEDCIRYTDFWSKLTAAATATGSNNMTGVSFLFIQGAESGSLSEIMLMIIRKSCAISVPRLSRMFIHKLTHTACCRHCIRCHQ